MYTRITEELGQYPLEFQEKIYYHYKLPILFDEVKKRTSLLGKHRYNKEGVHLLEQIAMTSDDELSFKSYLLEASAEVYDAVAGVMPKSTKSYRFEPKSNINKVTLPAIPTLQANGSYILTHVGYGIKIAQSYVGTPIGSGFGARLKTTITYQVSYTLVGSSVVSYEERTQEVEAVATIKGNDYNVEWMFYPQIKGATATCSAEAYRRIVDIAIPEVILEFAVPVTMQMGDILELTDSDGKVNRYRANWSVVIRALDELNRLSNYPVDISDSLIYVMQPDIDFDTNGILAIDIALFNMLIYSIIWKWLLVVSPEDCAIYKQMYEDTKLSLISRVSKLDDAEITPRFW